MPLAVHMLVCLTRNISMICTVILIALVSCNFMYTLHSEHATARQRLTDDQWLLKQCGDPDFFMRLKQHTDLCQDVEVNARRSILLHSFSSALRTTQLCGFDSCTNIATALVDTILRGGIITIAIAIAIIITLPVVSLHMYRRFIDNVSEHHLRTKYNMPYGLNTSMLYAHQDHAAATAFNNPSFRTRALDNGTQHEHVYQMLSDNI